PVQSMQGERLASARIGANGIDGDRAWGIVDPDLGEVVSSAQGKRKWRGIVTLAARYTADPVGTGAVPVDIRLPDGGVLRSNQPDIDARLSEALGSPAHLAAKAGESVRTAYRNEPLHLLTTASMLALSAHHPEGRFVPARFRPNIVIDTDGLSGFVEQGWIEQRFRIGETLTIAVTEHCKRCVMTTLPQGELPMDPAILYATTTLNETRAGVYAVVVMPGTVKTGDPVRRVD
ncbi:MAG: MOSC domain-containing protein, partial [Dongiaceae bacterium]